MSKGTVILTLVILVVLVLAFTVSIRGCGVYGRRGYHRPPGAFYTAPQIYYAPVLTGSVREGGVGGRSYRGGGIGGGK